MNPAVRKIALLLPPLRRLYDFAMLHSKGHMECQAQLQEDRTRLADTNRLLAETQQLREDLELQLYVTRSDLQRAAVRNEALSTALAELESEVKLSRDTVERIETLDAQLRHGLDQIQSDISLVYGKLAGKLSMLESGSGAGVARPTANIVSSSSVRYLDLLESALTGLLWEDEPIDPWSTGFEAEIRAIGRDWPKTACTMIGSARLRNFRNLIETALAENVPGDILEAGVWRGGACILARAVLAVHNVDDRCVWLADSFQGLPSPDDKYPADIGDKHSTYSQLSVSEELVQKNFAKFGLLDEHVKFLPGWFEDTLPTAPVDALSVLRIDGDMYSSTTQALNALYHKVSVGGFVIIDDYILKGCREAVEDFRKSQKVTDPLQEIDGAGVFWKKSRSQS